MGGLSYGVIRVNTEDKNSALTVQDVIPVNANGVPIGEIPFVRSGLLGFVGPGSLIFVVGKIEGLLMVSGRRHNADDLVATALAVEPVKTVQPTLPDKFDLVVWLPLQAIDSIHQVGLYCLALVPANTLPKTPLGGIHISDTKQFFLDGNLHPCNILMCPHTCVTNLPKPRQKQPGPASVMVGNLVAGKRIAQAVGRDLGMIEDQDLVRKVL
ncbi:hypothetical protein GOODEAATRI_026231 [Goodea atripinnis]|uniref:Uncharacterized protein n=1 Tax=Goodea atripinnis TaxID=208336 RepID=A0ABV0PRU0_9TELE